MGEEKVTPRQLTCQYCHQSFTPNQLLLIQENADTAFCSASGMFHNFDGYHLTYEQGQQVAEILRRYVDELLEQKRSIELYDTDPAGDSYQVLKDIEYIKGLLELFNA